MSLAHELQSVKTNYFPRWDRKNLWRVVNSALPRKGGRCEFATKTIRARANKQDIQWILLHEICHAVTRLCGHGPVWQERMLVAAKQARKLLNLQLAQQIEQDVRRLRQAIESCEEERPSMRDIVSLIKEAVSFDKETPTFPRIVAYLAETFGVTKKEFLATYSERTLKKEYDQSQDK
jgi:hypothetical protein